MSHSYGTWFLDHSVRIFPLHNNPPERRKEPACKSWDDYLCRRPEAARIGNYGVALSTSLGVVDTDTPETEAWVAAHVPSTPFMVRTGRGIHRYFRLVRPTPKFLHRDGHTIEFRNAGQYVVGPGSVHPTGAIYEPDEWSWKYDDITAFPEFLFDDRPGAASYAAGSEGYVFPEAVYAGERHDQLFKLLRQFKAQGSDKASAREIVRLANQNFCVPPVTEDSTFERWFSRGWDNPDRPILRLEKPIFGGDPWENL